MYDGHHLGIRMGIEGGLDLIGTDHLAEVDFDSQGRAAVPLDDLGLSLPEKAVDPHDHLVTRLDNVTDGRLHRRHAGAGKCDGQLVFGLKEMTQESHRVVHDRQEFRVEITQNRTCHGTEYARMQVAGTRPEEDTGIVSQFSGRSIASDRHVQQCYSSANVPSKPLIDDLGAPPRLP